LSRRKPKDKEMKRSRGYGLANLFYSPILKRLWAIGGSLGFTVKNFIEQLRFGLLI
jgi:hypothetical protein